METYSRTDRQTDTHTDIPHFIVRYTVGDPVLQKINVSVIMSFRSKVPGCIKVLYDYFGLYNCQSLDSRSVDTVHILNSDICIVPSNHEALLSGYVTPKTRYNIDIYVLQYRVPFPYNISEAE
jgi:hypothetical protein